jgi:hypothetical protein
MISQNGKGPIWTDFRGCFPHARGFYDRLLLKAMLYLQTNLDPKVLTAVEISALKVRVFGNKT